MKVVEFDIARLTRSTELDHQTLTTLQEILPAAVISKKDKNGNIIISDEFWTALVDKVRNDDTLFEKEIKGGWKSGSKSDLSIKDIRGVVKNEFHKTWEVFIKANQDKLIAWDSKKLDDQVRKAGENNSNIYVKATREEMMQAIKKNWDETRYEIQSQLGPISKKLENSFYQISRLEHKAVSKEAANSIAHDVLSKLIPNAKLTAQSYANLKHSSNVALTRVNHFSPGTGAIINPILTSPSYLFPAMDVNSIKRFAHWLFLQPIPRPNPPSVALRKWNEYGDCWCSPSTDRGFGPSLAIIAGNYIQPDYIIVEHIQESATLEPGSAPREMELLAYMEDEEVLAAFESSPRHSSAVVRDEPRLAGWVRLSSWVYDASSDQSFQTFGLLDLREFGERVAANQFIVRAKTNWNPEDVKYTCMYRVRLTGDVVIKQDNL